MDDLHQERLFGRTFEKLGQERRAQVLRGLGVIDPATTATFDSLKKIRNKYLHLWSYPHESIEADARNALDLARKALGTVLTVSIENGVVSLHPALDAYLDGKKLDQGSRQIACTEPGSGRSRGGTNCWQRTTWTLELLGVQLTLDAGVRLSASHVRNVLLANQVRRRRPRVGLRIPVRGRRRVLNEIDRLVERADAEDEVFYVDEADIDLNPRIGTTYMRRGKQLVVLTPGKNVKRYVAGALNARSGKVVHVVAERKNSEFFLALVDALRRAYRRARRIHLVLDNFIIHKSRRTLRHLARLGGRIVLHFLPPYSPESNVIERLWKQLHDHVTRNHTHRAIEPLMEAVDEFIEGAQPFPGAQVSLLPHAA